MAIMLSRLHAALIQAGVPDDKAREAAEEVTQFRDDISDLKSTLRLHTWIMTSNTAGILLLLGLALHKV